MLSARDLKGCYPALITPMKKEEGRTVIDVEAFHYLIAKMVDAGVTGLLFAGTTGQSATLTHDEQVKLVNDGALYARGYAAGKGRDIQILASAGSNSTMEAVDLSRRILAEGRVDALLHVTGYYNNPPQEGLYKHFALMGDIAGECNSSVILYNVPGRTNSNLEAETTIELAKHPAIVAVKEASGKLDQVQKIIDNTDKNAFTVISGEDHLVAEIIKRGGSGVISASANAWPREFQVLCELALAGEHEKAAELQEALMPCVKATFCVKNPIPLHYILKSEIRAPLVTINEIKEPARSKAIETINAATAITEFVHVGTHVSV